MLTAQTRLRSRPWGMVRGTLGFTAAFIATLVGWGQVWAVDQPINLRPTVSTSAFHDARSGPVRIFGSAVGPELELRVTTSRGQSITTKLPVIKGGFQCRYPDDFAGADKLYPGVLFIDAANHANFKADSPGHFQAEIAVIVHRGKEAAPELPAAFTDDLLDHDGRKDQRSVRWPAVRALANLYMHSRAAHLAGVGNEQFDLARVSDLDWFKSNLTLYEFDHRDRDWSKPLGHRIARTFWQSVWNTWYNASNDHPLDGNTANQAQTNYLPYAFANDFSDLLIMELMGSSHAKAEAVHQTNRCREATENLLAMQHRDPSNFALPDAKGRRENYTAGAFRYGLFETGEFMTEGKGWFYNPAFRDYELGGVINGRAVWALGEALRHDPQGPLAPRVREALALALKFCLHDGAAGGYVKRTKRGNVYWRDAGEHAYLLLGMLAACKVAPELKIPLAGNAQGMTLLQACSVGLDALTDLEKPIHQWTIYPNVDAMAVAALALGAKLRPEEPGAATWRAVAGAVADAWLSAEVDPKECGGPPVHFGLRVAPTRMTYIWPGTDHPRFFFYQTGHWIHALAEIYSLTGEARYRHRAEAMVSYLCGNNPWQVRLFNELGGVYNWSDDINRDGLQDFLKQDMYPESTAFCQIGILRLWQAVSK